jgi:hypothetical protein
VRVRLRAWILTTAALAAAVAVWVGVTLPPPASVLAAKLPATIAAGAYHIHTSRSDGTGSIDDIAAAAARAGLQFVILTDHGDATRVPDPPAYRHGVLVIDAVEINTREGHVVALGLQEASAYPLAGPSADVITDIHRMGGVAIVAHPDSPRSELAWRGSLLSADGIEWINVDSEWRDDRFLTLAGRAVHAVVRPAEAIASLFSRPERTLQRWDAATRTRPIFSLAAVDAHAGFSWRGHGAPRRGGIFARPGYETLFRTVVQNVVLDRALTGDAPVDTGLVLDAIRAGRSYSAVRAFAWPAVFDMAAHHDGTSVPMGSRLDVIDGSATLTARVDGVSDVRLELYRNGEPYDRGRGALTVEGLAPGTYRVEAYLPGIAVPWIVGNPIVIGSGEVDVVASGRGRGGRGTIVPPGTMELHPLAIESTEWRIERDPSSNATIAREEGQLRFDYTLGDGTARGQYAALVHPAAATDGVQTIRFTAWSPTPMRLSVQIRLPAGRGREGQRWRTSVYLDDTPRPFEVSLQDFEPADRPTARQPIVTPIDSLLFVVDTINAKPGSSGTVRFSNISLGVNRMEQ